MKQSLLLSAGLLGGVLAARVPFLADDGPASRKAGLPLTATQAALLSKMSLVDRDDGFGGVVPMLRIQGANVRLINGLGATNGTPADPTSTNPLDTNVNGLGNVVLGYLEDSTTLPETPHTGSHNLVIGTGLEYTSFGGIVHGADQFLRAPYGTLLGGRENGIWGGNAASAIGGRGNALIAGYGSAVGGYQNLVTAVYTAAVGGHYNDVRGEAATISGGFRNLASGLQASVSGGQDAVASGTEATVAGGHTGTASGNNATVLGGQGLVASGSQSVASGGYANRAEGPNAVAAGGQECVASGSESVAMGGYRNVASGNNATVTAGNTNTANGTNATVTGGRQNRASGTHSSVSGGYQRSVTGNSDWRAGDQFEND